jgi:hypothetical protein
MAPHALVRGDDLLRVSDEMRRVARSAAGGWLYVVDRHFDASADVPDHGLIGAWRIDDAGEVGDDVRANPEYRPSPAARGWPAPADELDRTAQLAAAGYATLDDVAVTLLFEEVSYAVDESGAPILDDESRVVAYSSAALRPAVPPADGSWDVSTGRALAVRNARRAAVLVNPGRWESTIPGAELAIRAGGEASGYLLAERLEEFLAGDIDGLALHDVFCASQVFCEAGERPGFQAVDEGGEHIVPVFTTLVELARFAGQTPWFSALGQDVLDLLPDGYDIVFDPGTPRAVRLRGDATRRRDPEPVGGDG